jgi:hypothetical protein
VTVLGSGLLTTHSAGTLFGVTGTSGGGGGDKLIIIIIIDKETGAISEYAPFSQQDGNNIQDMEGLFFNKGGFLYGTTGLEFTGEGTDNTLYKIDSESGITEPVTRLDRDSDGYVPNDFEAVSCF